MSTTIGWSASTMWSVSPDVGLCVAREACVGPVARGLGFSPESSKLCVLTAPVGCLCEQNCGWSMCISRSDDARLGKCEALFSEAGR